MAKFRYSLQSILDIKRKMETQAKQEFQAAINALDDEEAKLSALYARKASYEQKSKKLLSGKLHIRDIEENRNAILVMEQMVSQQKERVRKAEKKVSEARERLTDVMKERKTHETLREKAFEEFLQEENRQESKTVDELVSYTYGQKREE